MGNIAFGSLHSALVSFLSIALLMGMSPSRLSAQDDSSGDKSNTIELTESTPNVLLGFRLIEATKSLEILSQQRKRIVDVQSQPFHLSPVSEREATRIDELLDRVDGTNQAYEQLKARVEAYRNNMRQSSTRAAPIPPQPAPDKESAEGQPSPNPSLLDANNVSSNANQQESRALLLECKLLYSRLNAYQSALSKVERQLREEKFDLLGIEGRLDHASQTLNSLKSRDGISIESSVSYPSNAQMAWDTSRVPDYAYSPFGDGLNPYDYSTSSSSNSIGYGNLSSTADSTFYEIINELDRIEQLNTTIPQTQQRVAEQLSFLKSENESVGKRIAEVKTQAKEELARVDDQVKAVTAEKKSIEEALNNRDTTLNQFSINKLLIYAVCTAWYFRLWHCLCFCAGTPAV